MPRLSGPLALGGGLILALVAALAGVSLSGGAATSLACLALLLFGLPHGTLDLEIIRARLSGPWTGLVTLTAFYLSLAGAMYGLWRIEPVLALAAFIVIAVVHFSEDWQGAGSALLSAGLALALLAAPTLAHSAELDAIFVGLTGRAEAVAVSEGLTLVAPVALAVGFIAIIALWQRGRRHQAVGGLAALIGMLALPPIIGFALYFCLFHSPRHFRESLSALRWSGFARWGWVVVPLTIAAGTIASLIFGFEPRAADSDRIMAASFMTLSILTVPHMLVPILVAGLARRGRVLEARFTPR
jgi:Brp/Blh family beta-carotene 15,15'-monooxygenase